MWEFGLKLTEDGRVVEGESRPPIHPKPELTFTLQIAEQPVQVEYTPSYFPMIAKDSFQFSAEKNPLSESGFWHTFAPHDAVEVVGGPEKYAAMYAEARLTGAESDFMEQFEGRFPERTCRKRVGKHTATVAEESQAEQKGLFDA